MEVSSMADASDVILGDLTRNIHSIDLFFEIEIRNLVDRIQKSFQQVPPQTFYTFTTGSNTNNGGQQSTGSITVSFAPNVPLQINKETRPKSYGHVPNLDIISFKDEIEALLDHLMNNDRTQALGIVGMGGSGKTTLAKHLYHHLDIESHFALRVWVCITQSWNKRDVLQEIWRQTAGASSGAETTRNMGDGEIMERLYTFLSSRSYLVVLDDIWNVAAWNDISHALPICRGSKIVITTRNIDVPKCISLNFFVLEPNPLNAGESYDLFCKRMYPEDENSQITMRNKEVKMVLKRCKGLPLAIIALAGVLGVDESPSKWRRIIDAWTRRTLDIENSSTQGIVEEVLALSYSDLPLYLRPCVLYLSIFPEDCMIQAERVMQLWIAECLIRCTQENEEYVAEGYLEEMIQRHIIQDVSRNYIGQVQTFRIHDLFRQMIVDTANKEGFLKDSRRIVSSLSLYIFLNLILITNSGFSNQIDGHMSVLSFISTIQFQDFHKLPCMGGFKTLCYLECLSFLSSMMRWSLQKP